MEEERREIPNYGTRDLFINILDKQKSPYTLGDECDDYDICFVHRGETLYADVMNCSLLADIIDPFWYSIDLKDTKEFAMLKEAINVSNYKSPANTFYIIDRKEKKVHVHSRMTLHLSPQIPNVESFVRGCLNEFTLVRRSIFIMLSKMRSGKRPDLGNRRDLSMLTSTMKRNPDNYWNKSFRDMDEQELLNILNHPSDYDEDFLEIVQYHLDIRFPQ